MHKAYEDCLMRTTAIKKWLKESYPKMIWSFFDKNILDFLWFDNKMLNPTRPKFVKEKYYHQLLGKLEKFNKKRFVLWLINKSN